MYISYFFVALKNSIPKNDYFVAMFFLSTVSELSYALVKLIQNDFNVWIVKILEEWRGASSEDSL